MNVALLCLKAARLIMSCSILCYTTYDCCRDSMRVSISINFLSFYIGCNILVFWHWCPCRLTSSRRSIRLSIPMNSLSYSLCFNPLILQIGYLLSAASLIVKLLYFLLSMIWHSNCIQCWLVIATAIYYLLNYHYSYLYLYLYPFDCLCCCQF